MITITKRSKKGTVRNRALISVNKEIERQARRLGKEEDRSFSNMCEISLIEHLRANGRLIKVKLK